MDAERPGLRVARHVEPQHAAELARRPRGPRAFLGSGNYGDNRHRGNRRQCSCASGDATYRQSAGHLSPRCASASASTRTSTRSAWCRARRLGHHWLNDHGRRQQHRHQ